MKKHFSLIIAVMLVLSVCIVFAAAEGEPKHSYSIMSYDASKWVGKTVTSGEITETATISKDGDAIVVAGSTSIWPYAEYDVEDPQKVDIDDYVFTYEFTVTGGKANVILFCEGSVSEDNVNYITGITHLIAPDGDPRRAEGTDDLLDGTYSGSVKLSDMDYTHVTLAETGKLTVSGVKVFTVGGASISITKLAIESIETKDDTTSSDDPSSSEPESSDPSSSSSAPASSEPTSSETSKPVTGDEGTYVFIAIAVISLAAAAVLVIRRKRA